MGRVEWGELTEVIDTLLANLPKCQSLTHVTFVDPTYVKGWSKDTFPTTTLNVSVKTYGCDLPAHHDGDHLNNAMNLVWKPGQSYFAETL